MDPRPKEPWWIVCSFSTSRPLLSSSDLTEQWRSRIFSELGVVWNVNYQNGAALKSIPNMGQNLPPHQLERGDFISLQY
ncbi:hypothetical protein LINPERHAP1_LOCUS20443 [Linum perenne]